MTLFGVSCPYIGAICLMPSDAYVIESLKRIQLALDLALTSVTGCLHIFFLILSSFLKFSLKQSSDEVRKMLIPCQVNAEVTLNYKRMWNVVLRGGAHTLNVGILV